MLKGQYTRENRMLSPRSEPCDEKEPKHSPVAGVLLDNDVVRAWGHRVRRTARARLRRRLSYPESGYATRSKRPSAHNPDNRVAMEQVRRAEALVTELRSMALPRRAPTAPIRVSITTV